MKNTAGEIGTALEELNEKCKYNFGEKMTYSDHCCLFSDIIIVAVINNFMQTF